MVRAWALDKVTDTNGNYYTVTYQNNDATTGDYWPTVISYGGNTNAPSSPDHTITFGWTALPISSVQARFMAGSVISHTQYLTSITVDYAGNTAFTYGLGYDTSVSDHRIELTSVQECAGDGDCFPATAISWSSGAVGWGSATPAGASIVDAAHAAAAYLVDVNGDGINDLLYPGQSYWLVAFGKATGGFGTPVTTQVPTTNYQYVLVTDSNGDGRADLMVPGSTTWSLWESTGGTTTDNVFTSVPTGLSDTGTNSQTGNPIYEGSAAMTDYSGRGLGDFLYSDGSTLYLVSNGGASASPQYAGTPETMGTFSVKNWLSDNDISMSTARLSLVAPIDFDGSGRGGRLGESVTTVNSNTTNTWIALDSTDSGYVAQGTIADGDNLVVPTPMDANGDGLTDLLWSCPSEGAGCVSYQTSQTYYWQLYLSDASGFVQVNTGVEDNFANDPVVADYYGDGRHEAIVPDPNSSTGWSMIRVNYNPTVPGFAAAVTSGVSAPYPSTYVTGTLRVGPIEAQGLDDQVFAEDNGGSYGWYYKLHNKPSGVAPDTVTTITDGLGNYDSPTYAPLTDTGSYTVGTGATYPKQDVQAPLWVVSKYTASDGIGGTYTKTYNYSDAETDVTGHGFLGFTSESALDSRNGFTTTNNYDLTYPYLGDVTSSSVTQSNGDSITTSTNNYSDQTSGSGSTETYFPFVSSSTMADYDQSGNKLKTVVTNFDGTSPISSSDFDGNGDLLQSTVTTTDDTSGGPASGQTFSTQIITGYADNTNTGNYCIDLPISVSVTKTNSNGSITRTTTSPQDTSTCRPQSITLNAGAQQTETTAYTYDYWGNPSSITVSGTGVPVDRYTVFDYSAYQGEYPDSVTRCVVPNSPSIPTSCTRGLTTAEAWDPSRGVETSTTDPNNNVTTFGYDGLGERTSETLPYGAVKDWSLPQSFSNPPGGGPCPAGVTCYSVSASESAGGATIPFGTTVYGSLGQVVETQNVMLGGVTSYTDTHYDNLGRTVSVTEPYLAGAQTIYAKSTTYDVLGRPHTITAPANQSDTGSSEDVTTFTYDGYKSTATTIAPNTSNIANETKIISTNALGRIVSETDGNGAVSATTQYQYDAFGDLLSTTDADGQVTTMKYDDLGHKYQMTDPNMGAWTYTPDALGEVIAEVDAKNQTIQQVYDPVGRLTSRTEYNASNNVTMSDAWQWDTAANGNGKLASESDSNGFSRSYTYDQYGRPIEADTTVPGTSTPYAVNTSYDSFGRVSTVTYPASVAPSLAVASATASPTSTTIGNNITLDGSGSTDPNGLSMSYDWSQIAGPGTASISDPTAQTTTVTTSVPGNYTFQLIVSDQNGSSTPASVSVTFYPPTPGAPTISPSPDYNGNYTVSWNAVTSATSYELYESTNGTTYTDLGGVNSTSDSLGGKTSGTYYYKVAACANGVCSSQSSAASVQVTLPPGTVPTSSLSITPNPSTTGSYTLSWSAVTGATGYDIYLSSNGGSYGMVTSTSSTSYTTSKGDGSYSYYLTACDAGGCSAASSSVTESVTLPPGTPGTPSVSPNPSTNGDFTVSWTAPSGTYTSETLYESPNDSTWTAESGVSGTSWSGSGFSNGTYYFKVTYCEDTACSTSGVGSVTVLFVPSAPTGLTLSPNPSTNGSFTVSWTAVATATSYHVYKSGSWAYTTSSTSQAVSGLGNGSYAFYVVACNSSGCSGASSTVTETVLLPPGAPSSISLSPTSTYQYDPYTLSWSAASGTVSYYEINGNSSFETSALSYQFQGKARAGSYNYYVQACNSSGCGPDSATVTETILSGGTGGGCKTCSPTVTTPPPTSGSSTPAPTASSGGGLASVLPRAIRSSRLGNLQDHQEVVPDAQLGAKLDSPILVALARARSQLAIGIAQPSEARMQQEADARAAAAIPSLLPPAPAKDIADWRAWDKAYKRAHPHGPNFAPPEYIAYANAKVVPATSTPYRFEIQYSYDAASGALTSVANAQTGFVYWQAATGGSAAPVDAFGHLLGWTDGNNVSTVMGYDAATGAPVGISSGIGQTSSVQSLVYTWDGYGNLEERQDANQNLSETFTYDDLNRLTQSTVTNPAANGPVVNYSYDAAGNILTNSNIGTYTYDRNHPYAVDLVTNTSGTAYSATYDADGNMITRNGFPITWTVDNFPESISSAQGSSTFSYDPEHQRYYQEATDNSVTTDTTYIENLFEVVAGQTTTEYRHNIIADGQVIAVHTIDGNGNATTSYLHHDQLGGVNAITNDQGIVAQQMSFDSFGLRRDPTNWDYDLTSAQITSLKKYTDRGFTFQEELDNVGLIHMNGRVYDPSIGRFISPDPSLPNPLYSQAFNRYSYVYNNPLSATDSSGLDPCPSSKTSCPTKKKGGDTETGSHIAGVDTGCEGCSEGPGFAGGHFVNGVGRVGGSGQEGGGGGSTAASNANVGAQNVAANTEGAIQTGSDGSTTIFLESISVSGQYSEWNQFSTWQTLFNNSTITIWQPADVLTALTDLIFAEDGLDYKNPTALEQVGYIPINRANSGLANFSNTILGNIYQQDQFASVGGNNWNLTMYPQFLTGADAAAYMASSLAAQADLNGTAYNSGALWMWTNNVPYPSWLNNGLQNGTIQKLGTFNSGNIFFSPTPPGG